MTYRSTEGTATESPQTPSRRRRRQAPPLPFAPPPDTVRLPPGHRAEVYALPTSTGFVGSTFSMDSSEFMRFAAKQYKNERVTMAVLLYLIGCQEVGGEIHATQAEIAHEIPLARSSVNSAYGILEEDGVLRKLKRGRYQLNPALILRGGRPKSAGKSSSKKSREEPVGQLDLLRDILQDPNAPEAFKAMANPGTRLDDRKDSPTEETGI